MMFPLNPTIAHNGRLTDDEFYAFCQANPTSRTERDAEVRSFLKGPPTQKPDFETLT